MSSITGNPDRLHECAVCTRQTSKRCSSCPDANVFLCSWERQKLVSCRGFRGRPYLPLHRLHFWPVHKHLCGGPPAACYFPPLTQKERSTLQQNRHAVLEIGDGDKTLEEQIRHSGLHGADFETLLTTLTNRDCAIPEPTRSRILVLCNFQLYTLGKTTPWFSIAIIHLALAEQTYQLEQSGQTRSLPITLVDLNDPFVDPFKLMNRVYRHALTLATLFEPSSVELVGIPKQHQLIKLASSRVQEAVEEVDMPAVQRLVLADILRSALEQGIKKFMPDPKDESTALPAAALRLSTEIWIEIFERDELTYQDLKRLTRVCKRFHEIEKHHPLDHRLFRSPPPANPIEKDQSVRFHPVLNDTSLVCTSLEDANVYLRNKQDEDGSPFVPVATFPCVNEFATSPACKIVAIKMGGKPVARNSGGVTVKDVVEASAAMWTSKPDEMTLFSMADWLFEECGADEVDIDEVTWRDTLGDHCFWEGMEGARCTKKGVVWLIPQWFGS